MGIIPTRSQNKCGFMKMLLNMIRLLCFRSSFALEAWTNLGAVYPPALEKLKTTRDEAGENVRNKTGREAFESFFDYVAINEALKEDDKTKNLFIWLDANKPDVAKNVFDLAEPALIKSKEYHLCGKYINADASFAEALRSYRMTSQIAKNPKLGQKLQDFANKKFKTQRPHLLPF